MARSILLYSGGELFINTPLLTARPLSTLSTNERP